MTHFEELPPPPTPPAGDEGFPDAELHGDILEVANEIISDAQSLIVCCGAIAQQGFTRQTIAEALGHFEMIRRRTSLIANSLKKL